MRLIDTARYYGNEVGVGRGLQRAIDEGIVSREEVFAEVKKINKRRRKLYDSEYNMYVCKKFDLNPTEIVGTWKEKFGSYNAFERWLYEKE